MFGVEIGGSYSIGDISGGRLCTLIGVPWRGVGFSTLGTGWSVLKQYICKGAESAEHAETAGYTYEGTQTTAWETPLWPRIKCPGTSVAVNN